MPPQQWAVLKVANDLFNKTFKLIDWAMKSNMASVFTDCPHREKLGWLEERIWWAVRCIIIMIYIVWR
jgi:hypothetical protein